MYRIPLFDIDWTLLKGAEINKKAHRDAFDHALHTIYHLPSFVSQRNYVSEGKIDSQILMEMAIRFGVSEVNALNQVENALAAMTSYFSKHADEGTYEVMPGVVELLTDLKFRNIPLGLLTGNVEAIGWEKLRRAGIKDFFSFGAFGSMAYKRVDLIKIAEQKAGTRKLVIVGDSPLDIVCARDGGIPVITVGAGHYKSHELTSADLTVDSLEEKDKILAFLESSYE